MEVKKYRVVGENKKDMTAEYLAMELDIHLDRVKIALKNLIKKGLVREIKTKEVKNERDNKSNK